MRENNLEQLTTELMILANDTFQGRVEVSTSQEERACENIKGVLWKSVFHPPYHPSQYVHMYIHT